METPEFVTFQKIPRYLRDCLVTEKIDGTNAQVVIPEDPSAPILVGSRNRWIRPGKGTDNYDFADWVTRNDASLRLLGPGRHFGEWMGAGIARRYGLAERRWYLFSVERWRAEGLPQGLPAGVHLVPLLHQGPLPTAKLEELLNNLKEKGSVAVPGFLDPEGVVIKHLGGGHLYKITLDGDGCKGVLKKSPEETAS